MAFYQKIEPLLWPYFSLESSTRTPGGEKELLGYLEDWTASVIGI